MLLTKVKQVFKLIKDEREKCYSFSCDFPIRHVKWLPWKQNPVPKIPTPNSTSNFNFSISDGKLTQIAKK